MLAVDGGVDVMDGGAGRWNEVGGIEGRSI
jgi:hypothetical protein